MRFCDCFVDASCLITEKLYSARGCVRGEQVKYIILDSLTRQPYPMERIIVLLSDILITTCEDALYYLNYMESVKNFILRADCFIDLPLTPLENCCFYLNLCSNCKFHFLNCVSFSFHKKTLCL